MSLITTSRRSATRAPATFGQIQPYQWFWTGAQWNLALAVRDDDDPGVVRIVHRPANGPIRTTPYRRGRITSVLLDSRQHSIPAAAEAPPRLLGHGNHRDGASGAQSSPTREDKTIMKLDVRYRPTDIFLCAHCGDHTELRELKVVDDRGQVCGHCQLHDDCGACGEVERIENMQKVPGLGRVCPVCIQREIERITSGYRI
ncbi:hypothetical protein [Spirillospora sp. CA-128828]|uniref:hypothetical protein n=1 Tax=Spirillospora sp. CA-128828 TaxID=3240033 RepID=UPI003D8B1A38